MVYRRLGNTGLQVARICLGCMSYGKVKTGAATRWPWTLSEEDRRPYIKSASTTASISSTPTSTPTARAKQC